MNMFKNIEFILTKGEIVNIQQLKYVDYIERIGSINKAARALYLTPSTMSLSLKELENEFGIQIFNRSKKGMVLTPEGKEFMRWVRKILTNLDEMNEIFSEKSKSMKQFCISSQHYHFASEAFAAFLQSETKSSYIFRYMEGDIHKVIADVANYTSELGLIHINEYSLKTFERIFLKEELQFKPLIDFRPCAFFRKEHPLHKKTEITAAELLAYPAIAFAAEEKESSYFFIEAFEKQKFSKKVIVSNWSNALSILYHSDSYIIGSKMTSDKATLENLISIPMKGTEKRTIGFIHKENSPISSDGKKYIELLEKHIKYAKTRIERSESE